MRGQVRLGLGSIGAECSLMGGVGRDVRGGEDGGWTANGLLVHTF